MSKYQVIIFDWDGTLMDSAPKIVACMQQAAKLADLPVPSDDQVKHIIGISLVPAIQQLFNLTDSKKITQVRDFYKQVFVDSDNTPSPMFDGAHGLLEKLADSQKLLAVATGKARRGLERAWQQSQTKRFFHTSRCADEARSKPDPDMLVQILDELKLSPQQAIMVGDTSYDMAMAEEVGMDRIAVTYGAHCEKRLLAHTPTVMVHELKNLTRHLL